MTDLCAREIHPSDFEDIMRSKNGVFRDRGDNYKEFDGVLYHLNEQYPRHEESSF